jgi:hypothetical protein
VPEPGSESRLVEQEGIQLRIADILAVEALDGDRTRKSGVPSETPEMDDSHASRRELRVELVTPHEERKSVLHTGYVSAKSTADLGSLDGTPVLRCSIPCTHERMVRKVPWR